MKQFTDWIINLIHWITVNVAALKSWLSEKTTIPARDQVLHYMVSRWVVVPVSIFAAAAAPLLGIYVLLFLLLVSAAWELPQLVKYKFSSRSLVEAVADWTMSFKAVFPELVILVIIQTKYL